MNVGSSKIVKYRSMILEKKKPMISTRLTDDFLTLLEKCLQEKQANKQTKNNKDHSLVTSPGKQSVRNILQMY